MKNSNLTRARRAKNDEFYTQLSDIEKELKHYKEHFKGKTVLCNCDDPFESNFFKYFATNFNHLGLKKLITTCYADSHISYTQYSLFDNEPREPKQKRKAYKVVLTHVGDVNGDGFLNMDDILQLVHEEGNSIELLKGDGDFRSEECIEILKEADIVVTNPPFSLFRDFVTTLEKYKRKYIIVGPQNAIVYKEVFPLIKEDKLWFGYNKIKGFMQPNGAIKLFGNICWFTNISIPKRMECIPLYASYNSDDYSYYDNYDAIEVSKVKDIPYDYKGVMGVPVTFLDKYNPEQFEIIGMCENLDLYKLKTRVYTIEECKNRYFELFGKKGVYDLNASGVVNGKKLYARILIRNRHPEEVSR